MLINIHKRAAILQRAPETTRNDIHCNSAAVPSRVVVPGACLLRWRPADIDAWLSGLVQGGAK